MSERPGIHIPGEVATEAGVPDELDSSAVRPYRFPDPRRRRIAGYIYLGTGAAMALLAGGNPGLWVGVGLMIVLADFHLAAAWPLGLDQEQALDRAARLVPFAVGHASAAVTFHGWRSRPRWQVIIYSADNPPSRRALVVLDGVSGNRLGETYVEPVPAR